MIGTPITFIAVYKSEESSYKSKFSYRFVFKNEVEEEAKEIKSNYPIVSQTFVFEGRYLEGDYKMRVRVYRDIDDWDPFMIGMGENIFRLTESIPGRIDIFQANISELIPNQTLVASGLPTTLTAKVHDPSGSFANWTMAYRWMIDNETFKSLNNTVNYTFQRAGNYDIKVVVTATNDADEATQMERSPTQKFGEFKRRVKVREPIGRLNVRGES